jgi:hypothetical protein
MTCPHCHRTNTEGAFFCTDCGRALCEQDVVECENHPGTHAIGICVVCGKPVCGDCSVMKENKLYCDDVSHSRLMSVHAKLAAVGTEFEADMIVKNLSLNGVQAVQFSAKKFSHFCRLKDDQLTSIFVKIESIEKARGLIDEMGLDEFVIQEGGPQ